jgi:hypothetical protein
MITWFPHRTSASVNASPMPLPPPVMSTVFPEVLMTSSFLFGPTPKVSDPDCLRPLQHVVQLFHIDTIGERYS